MNREAIHLGKYHSMIVTNDPKRIYSPQVANRLGLARSPIKETKQPYVIGICGGPSSGKSTVANMLRTQLA